MTSDTDQLLESKHITSTKSNKMNKIIIIALGQLN